MAGIVVVVTDKGVCCVKDCSSCSWWIGAGVLQKENCLWVQNTLSCLICSSIIHLCYELWFKCAVPFRFPLDRVEGKLFVELCCSLCPWRSNIHFRLLQVCSWRNLFITVTRSFYGGWVPLQNVSVYKTSIFTWEWYKMFEFWRRVCSKLALSHLSCVLCLYNGIYFPVTCRMACFMFERNDHKKFGIILL